MHLSRRHFLRSAAATSCLPWLESLGGFAHATDAKAVPQRLLLINVPLGLFRDALIPKDAGAAYQAPEYLAALEGFRDRYTVISGLDHPGVDGGHASSSRIFTGVPSTKRNARSLDQYLAKQIGQYTRYDVLPLSAGSNEYSWTDGGTRVPAEEKMSNVYAKLFLDDSGATAQKVMREINQGKSLMDLAQRQAEILKPQLSQADREKLEEYFESVRETERRIVKSENWVSTPKPKVSAPQPKDPANSSEIITQIRNVCDMTHLAFQTDSTRIVTFGYFQQGSVKVDGVVNAYHALSHHSQDPNNIAQLKLIEMELFKEIKNLLTKLQNTKEGDATLLDRTTILLTANLGSGSTHSTKNLPLLLLGGRFNHGQHLAIEPNTTPLCNVFVSVLNQFGLADKTFATATGPLKGLEVG